MKYFGIVCILLSAIGLTNSQDLVLQCPTGWSEILANCYLPVSRLKTTWSLATTYCKRYGGKLAEPSGYDVTILVSSLIVNKTESYWIGFSQTGIPDTSPEQGFWSDGSQTFVDVGWWDNFQPDRRAGDCTALRPTNTDWRWYMTHCLELHPFICQAPPCPSDTFRCSNGQCIGTQSVCNGAEDCPDGLDERECGNGCNKALTGSQGEIIHPNNQSVYLPRTTCQWYIYGDVGTHLQLQITKLDLEDGIDYLEVWVGGVTISTSRLHSRLSGRNLNNLQPIISSNNIAIIRLVTDSSTQFSGFTLQWRSDFRCSVAPLSGFKPDDKTTTIPSSSFNMASCLTECSNLVNCVASIFDSFRCTLLSQVPSLIPAVGSTIYFKTCPQEIGYPILSSLPLGQSPLQAVGTSRQLKSPLYPVYSVDNLVTSWVITSTGFKVITLEVVDLDISVSGEITIHDGDSPASPTLLKLRHDSRHKQIISTSTNLYIYYNTGTIDTINRRGFLFTYREGCDFTIRSNQGEIISPGYARGLYPNILQCSWTIYSLTGTSLTLIFDPIFRLEQDKDILKVYKSNGPSDAVHTGDGFSGTTAPGTIVSPSGRLFIQFTTSALGQEKGFKASFSAGCNGLSDPSIQVEPYYSKYSHNEVITVTCITNHVFSNKIYSGQSSISLLCTNGGSWNKEIPTCSRVPCGTVPSVTNGYLISSTGPYSGSTATYACNYGYNMTRDATITCKSSGLWDNGPTCYATSCSAKFGINNGNLVVLYGNGYNQGSVLQYSCIDGYEIVGSNILTCNNGQWSNSVPTCSRVKCGYTNIANGIISPSGQHYKGDRLTLVCNQGYEISGSTPAFICGETPPTCINIDECRSGTANCVSSTCTDTIGSFTCTCNPGYTLSSFSRTSCNDINECSVNNGGCDQICSNTQGSYTCSCYSNYVLFTTNGQNGVNIPSGETGLESWNVYHYGHTCLAIQCPSPPQFIVNGRSVTTKTSFNVGDSVTYVCNVGYVTQGAATLTCGSTGSWNGQPPTCSAVTCSPPGIPPTSNGLTVSPQTSINYKDYFTLTCTLPNNQIRTERRACIYNEATRDYQVLSGSLECPVIDCGVPTRFSGTLPYSYTCTTYGCSFIFNCRTPWFQLAGSSSANSGTTVRCGVDGHWDFGDLRCPGPTCSDPGTPPGGLQVSSSYEEYSLVSYTCSRYGYGPTETNSLKCYWDSTRNALQWNSTMPRCIDKLVPTFTNCPVNDVIVSKMSTAGISTPRATDNSNMIATFEITPPTFSVDHVVKADQFVTYRATDHAGNQAICSFDIKIKDDRAPVISCQTSFTITLNNENDVRQYDVNSLVIASSDDSGFVNVKGSVDLIRIDRYSIGKTYTNTITATDNSGNTDQCVVQISVSAPKCQPWTLQMRNGQVSCNFQTNGGYICTGRCNTNYVFYENIDQSSVEVTCSQGGEWSRVLPVCVAIHSASYELSFLLSYQALSGSILSGCSSAYKTQLDGRMTSLISSLTNQCTSLNPPITVQQNDPITIQNYFSGVYATISLRLEPRDRSSSVYTTCATRIKNAFTTQSSVVDSIKQLSSSGSCPASYSATYQSTTTDGFGCSLNEEVGLLNQASTVCVDCPNGYYSSDGRLCLKCIAGYYRDRSSQSCQQCPPNSRNITQGAASIHDCYDDCPLGMISSTGKSPCTTCPINTYSRTDHRTCEQCPSGTQTPGVGAYSVNQCRGICQPGTYSITGFESCTPCPKGFYQPNSRSVTCLECALDQTTSSTGSTSQLQCQSTSTIECYSGRCRNGGTCYIEQHQYYCRCTAGFTGKDCSDRILACDSNPCYNNGICANNNNGGYTCYCSSGRFSGIRCEVDSNDCQFNQCLNNGSCHDKIGAYSCLCPSFSGFSGSTCQNIRDVCQEEPCTRGRCVVSGNIRRKCICDSGYTGDKCDQDINECLSSPCRNSGTCIDQVAGYTCQCASGYSGSNCEITSDKCSTFVCTSGTCVHNYQDGVTSCLCPSDYTNVNNRCQPTNYCTSTTCKNNGICRSGGSGYICDCPVGYEGYQCQHNKDDCTGQPCKNNAICIDQVNNFTCQCDSTKPDTGGRFCEDLKDNCSPYPCNSSNTRSCRDLIGDYSCDCYSGYTGKNCQDYVNYCASYPCQHGGICSNRAGGYTCQCTGGYSGNQCQQLTEYCSSRPCYNDGQCINTDVGYVCNCKSGYKGNRCQVLYDACAVANPCIGIGSRCSHDGTRFSCQCSGSYSGTYCEYKTNACTVSTCLNGGTCREVTGQPVCQCPTGFTDSVCSTNINDCSNTSCSTGAVCVDGVNSFTCKCETGKFGQACQKDVTYDFDLLVSSNGGYLSSDYFIQPQKLSSTNRLSLSFWVRYTELSSPGTIATLYGTNFADNVDQSKELLRFNNDNLVASIGNRQTMTYNEGKLVDGKWHHVMLTWDGTVPLLMLYIDSMSVNSANYGYSAQLPPYMWLVLGGTWNSTTKLIDQSSSMTGRISRMFVTSSVFSTAERISLDSTLTYVPSNAIHEFTSGILDGVNALVDYNSELNVDGCYVNDTCTPLTAASTSAPKATVCPSDLMIVSQRTDLPSWPKPIYNNIENIRTNRLPGDNPMDWGTYSIAFAGLDNQSNADVCSFNLYNRRSECAVPKKPLLGTISCVSVTDGIRCQVTCDQPNHRLAEPVPVYYSCGTHNSYGNNVLTYRYPSCTTCASPKKDITISMTFDLQLTCNSIGQPSIESNVRGSLIGLNNRYNGSICYSSDCSDISIISTCLFSATTTDITLQFKQIQSTITVGLQQLPTVDVLSTAIIDDAAITITSGSLVRSTYDITSTSVCDEGRQLLDGCCVECGFGTYYDMSKLECMKCPQGTYLDAIGSRSSGSGSTPCIGCPGGMTTPLVGAQTVDECKDSCAPGRFYNLTIGRCEDCPEGFYQELAGTFYCQSCPVTMTTASSKSTSASDCILSAYISSTVPPEVINTNAPSVGASTSSVWSPAIIALLVLVIIVVIVLIIVILCCCCRGCLQSICPCFVSKVGPDEKTEWHHVNRYGETNIKFVSYKLSDVRKKKLEKQALVKSDSEEEVPPRNISIQVPVFEEKLNGIVKKKSIHISSMAPQSTTHRSPKIKTFTTQAASIPSFTVASGQHPKPLPPLPDRLRKTPTSTPEKVRRPPSAFNKPRVHPTSNDYEEFLVNRQRVIQESKISIDSDDDDYR